MLMRLLFGSALLSRPAHLQGPGLNRLIFPTRVLLRTRPLVEPFTGILTKSVRWSMLRQKARDFRPLTAVSLEELVPKDNFYNGVPLTRRPKLEA